MKSRHCQVNEITGMTCAGGQPNPNPPKYWLQLGAPGGICLLQILMGTILGSGVDRTSRIAMATSGIFWSCRNTGAKLFTSLLPKKGCLLFPSSASSSFYIPTPQNIRTLVYPNREGELMRMRCSYFISEFVLSQNMFLGGFTKFLSLYILENFIHNDCTIF